MSSKELSSKDILQLDATAVREELAEGRISAEDLMTATLDRVASLSNLNAIIALRNRNELLEQARQCDQTLRKKGAHSGRLLGIPIAIKDMSNAAGLPTTMGGSPLFRFHYPKKSDLFVQKIIDEGAIVIGKTNAPELGVGSHTFNKRWGTTVNPYATDKSAGGSSGGAAVALAARMLCLADGSDMMGSLRNPAGWNNIYSHRPTAGSIPETTDSQNPNVNLLPYPISTPGPMARSPRDLALLMDIMKGSNSSGEATIEDKPNVSGFKIAWLGDWGGNIPVEEGILTLSRAALSVLVDKGVTVTDMTEPVFDLTELWKSWTTIRAKIIASNFPYPSLLLHSFLLVAPMRQELKWEVRKGMASSKEECKEAGNIARKWSTCLENLFEKYDALALPTAQTWPFPAEWKWPQKIEETRMKTYHEWMTIAIPASLAGVPAITIPAGFGENQLPMGIQLLGKRGDDAKLLKLAQAYHVEIDWPGKRPPTCRPPQQQN